MSDNLPTLLFLHGVGDGAPEKPWRKGGVDIGLKLAGYPDTSQLDVIEPDYRPLLQLHAVPPHDPPERTAPSAEESHRHRGRYEVAQASLRRLLEIDERDPFENLLPDVGKAAEVAAAFKDLRQAKAYAGDANRRALVLEFVLQGLPQVSTDVVIIGHSLGTLVAIDLLQYLPAHLRVRRLLTIGSPGGQRAFHSRGTRLAERFPYGAVDSWLNIVSSTDLATGGRGLGHLFPAAEDLMINLGLGKHSAWHYLSRVQAGRAVGEALFGSTHEPAPRAKEVDLGADEAEDVALLALAHGHRVLAKLKADAPKAAQRYDVALAIVQASVMAELERVSAQTDRSPSGRRSVSEGVVEAPQVWSGDPDKAVALLILAATTNVIEPYFIEDADEAGFEVLPQLAGHLGFSARYGNVIAEALREAKAALSPSRKWRIGLLAAAGVALLVTGPVGLAAAGAGGLAGGAAVTSALAAFGPGGMVGGMVLAGSVASAGAAATTAAVALANAPAAAVELQVLRRMANARARHDLKLPHRVDDWNFVWSLRSQVKRELDVHDGISEKDAPVVEDLEKKLKLLQRAADWMQEHDLGPLQIDD